LYAWWQRQNARKEKSARDVGAAVKVLAMTTMTMKTVTIFVKDVNEKLRGKQIVKGHVPVDAAKKVAEEEVGKEEAAGSVAEEAKKEIAIEMLGKEKEIVIAMLEEWCV
jgi:hypothetical protein